MNENTLDEDDSQRTEYSVSLNKVLELECGDMIAVRASIDGSERILAGQLSSEPATRSEIDDELDEIDGAWVISIDGEIWWEFKDDQIEVWSHRLLDRSPSQSYVGESLKEAPSCGLGCRADGSVYLIIPGPVYRGSRLAYYAPDPMGTVVEMETGEQVDLEPLLPDRYDPDHS